MAVVPTTKRSGRSVRTARHDALALFTRASGTRRHPIAGDQITNDIAWRWHATNDAEDLTALGCELSNSRHEQMSEGPGAGERGRASFEKTLAK